LELVNYFSIQTSAFSIVIIPRMFRDAVVAALLLGLVMTLGDIIWSAMRLPHRMAYGVAHGAAMCLCLGAVVGWRVGRVAAGTLAGPVIGVAAALAFYALAPSLRYAAMFPAWMLFWMLFALLQQRLARRETVTLAAVRGLAAAIFSGLAFYAISGIWTRPPSETNYLLNFAAWSFAFLPGFVALFWVRGSVGPWVRRSVGP
jgi:hypothetical protein